MLQRVAVGIDIEKELERIEDKIITQNRIIDDLVWQRAELLTKKQDLEMCALIDCIIENGLSANEALEIIVYELGKKSSRNN